MRKATIAKEAYRQLTGMAEMLAEDHWSGHAASFHANSANNYLASIRAVNGEIPAIVLHQANFLRAHGWRI